MASEKKRRDWHVGPVDVMIAVCVLAIAAGCFLLHSPTFTFFVACALIIPLRRSIKNSRKRLCYVMNATLANDFSYKFPTEEIGRDEREINEMLNNIVEHLERLSSDAKQSEAFLSHIINVSDIGLIVADSNGDVRLHNDAAVRLLDRPVLTNLCQIPDNANGNLDIRRRQVTVNDRSFTLLTLSDLSRRMQEVEVESWEKLTRVLTHEIMNSLTPIQSIAENMSAHDLDRESKEAFETIASSSRSLMQFVRNFREFSRLPEPRMKAIYLKPILDSCIRMAKSYADEKGIAITLTCFPPELMVYTDESLLSQLLLNILKNAIEAQPSQISIEAEEKGDESVEIRISNDGDPIPDETAEHIFTPFFTTRESGSGIGLSLSRRIITHLGGSLTFKTRPITSFSVRI